MARSKRRKRTAIVPRIVFAACFAGVVPVCVVGCDGSAPAPPDLRANHYFDVFTFPFEDLSGVLGVADLGFTPDDLSTDGGREG
jgi:hypothetical protein